MESLPRDRSAEEAEPERASGEFPRIDVAAPLEEDRAQRRQERTEETRQERTEMRMRRRVTRLAVCRFPLMLKLVSC